MAALIELKAENFKRLQAVELKPAENGTVIIAGRNAQGKSSILDAIVAALCGKASIDEVPVRQGADSATIECVISTEPPLRVVRRLYPDGKTTLTLTQVGGDFESKVSKPQQTLDSLVGKVAFDPLEFTRLAPAKQLTLLKDLVGICTDEIDGEIEASVEARKLINRDVDQLKGQIKGMHEYKEVQPVDVAELMAELEKCDKHNSDLRAAEDREARMEQEIESLKSDIAEVEKRLEDMKNKLAEQEAEYKKFASEIGKRDYIDTEPIKQRISQAGEINRQVQANKDREQVDARLKNKMRESDTLTKSIEDLRSRRLALMDSAKWPVEGLGFGASGVTYNGLPFSQCSSAEQLRISTAIGLSQNPKIRLMLIRDGSLLDDENLLMLHDMAIEANAQIIVERVGTGKAGEIVIEDGTVQAAELAAV